MAWVTRDYDYDKGETITFSYRLNTNTGYYDLLNCHVSIQAWDPAKPLSPLVIDIDDQAKGGVVLGGAAGTILGTYADNLSAQIKQNKLEYRVMLTFANGDTACVAKGFLNFDPGK